MVLSNEEGPSCSTSNNNVTTIRPKTTTPTKKVAKKNIATGRVQKRRIPKNRTPKKRTPTDCDLSNEEGPSCSTSNNNVTTIRPKTTTPTKKVAKKIIATVIDFFWKFVGIINKITSVTEFFNEYYWFYDLYDYLPWETQSLDEEGFSCDSTVIEANLNEYHGITMELFIRKYLCSKFNIEVKDYNCIKVLHYLHYVQNEMYLDLDLDLDLELRERLQDSYDVYTDAETNAIDIIDDIKTIALSNRKCFNELMENVDDADNMIINESNLIHICKFLDTLNYENLVFKKFFHLKLNNVTLRGQADYIFDDHVFYQIATSQNVNAFKYKGMKVLFYILSHYYTKYYGDELSKSYKIIIYNPLLCFTHTADIIITPELFDVVKDCIEQAVDGKNVDFEGLFEKNASLQN